MFLAMRRVGYIVLCFALLPWLALGHARFETVLSCAYRQTGDAPAPTGK